MADDINLIMTPTVDNEEIIFTARLFRKERDLPESKHQENDPVNDRKNFLQQMALNDMAQEPEAAVINAIADFYHEVFPAIPHEVLVEKVDVTIRLLVTELHHRVSIFHLFMY